MTILRNGFKAGLIGFVAICLLELLRILPYLYCLKGIFQILLWFIIGMLVGYFYLRDTQVISFAHILPASLIASLFTVSGGLLSALLLKAILSSSQLMLTGDMMFPFGLDPLDQSLPLSILSAAVLGIIGSFVSIGIWQFQEKRQSQVDMPGPDQKSGWKWPSALWFMVLGGGSLALLTMIGIAIISGDESGNLSGSNIGASFLLPAFIPGAIAGLLVYPGRAIGFRKQTPANRIPSVLVMILRVFLFLSVCMALALFVVTLNMM